MSKDPVENRSKDPHGYWHIPQAEYGPLTGPMVFGVMIFGVIVLISLAIVFDYCGK